MTPHANMLEEPALTAFPDTVVPPPPPLRAPNDRPDVTVYGYWPYWGDPLDTLRWDQLTHVAIFDVGLASNGTLTNTYRWHDNAADAVALAAPYGVKVHLTVTSFSDTVMNTVLASPQLRATAIAELVALVDQYGADGVNVDFEGLDAVVKDEFTAFIQELNAVVDEVFIATPAVDWSGAYDYDELAFASDGLFIMGYEYHWSGGDPGPTAPLFGGSPWSQYSLDWSVGDYRTWGAPDDKIILGLPLYGRDWPSTDNSVPGTGTGTGSAVVYSLAVPQGLGYGRQYDAQTENAYAFPTGTRQLWYDDATSVPRKVAYAVDEGLQGVGFWALTYEDTALDLWTSIDALTHPPSSGIAVSGFRPGRAAQINELVARDATPGAEVTFVIGWQQGGASVPGCTENLAFGNPLVLGSVTADPGGEARLSIFVPPQARNTTAGVQVIERASCAISPVALTSF